MDLRFSTEQEEFEASLRRLFTDRCPPSLVRQLKEGDGGEDFDAFWDAVRSSGLIGVGLPERYGGGGGGLTEVGMLAEQAGKALAPAALDRSVLFGLALHAVGGEAMRERWLPRLCRDGLIGTVVLDSDDGSGRLTARRQSGGWQLSGSADLVIVPQRCDVVLLPARTENGERISAVLETTNPGLRIHRHDSLGSRDLCSVQVDDTSIEDVNVALGSGDWVRDLANVLESLMAVGGADQVLTRTCEYIANRVQFGRPIGSFQAPQHHVANVAIAIDGARLMAYETLELLSSERPTGMAACVSRAFAASTFKTATLRAHQLHGGMGMTLDSDLHLWSERAKMLELLGGGWDQMLELLGDDIADHYDLAYLHEGKITQ